MTINILPYSTDYCNHLPKGEGNSRTSK